VTLCIALGYEEIVLFGVDLGSNAYFFDHWRGDPELREFLAALGPPAAVSHPTASAAGSRPGIVDALVALDRFLLRPAGRRITVANEGSLLHPGLAIAESVSERA
jgi:hypothetical protein